MLRRRPAMPVVLATGEERPIVLALRCMLDAAWVWWLLTAHFYLLYL